jgi:hypothetical protein
MGGGRFRRQLSPVAPGLPAGQQQMHRRNVVQRQQGCAAEAARDRNRQGWPEPRLGSSISGTKPVMVVTVVAIT